MDSSANDASTIDYIAIDDSSVFESNSSANDGMSSTNDGSSSAIDGDLISIANEFSNRLQIPGRQLAAELLETDGDHTNKIFSMLVTHIGTAASPGKNGDA